MPAGGGAQILRILTVTHFFERHGGGIEIVAGRLVRELASLGHESQWAASGADAPPEDASIETLALSTVDPLEGSVGLPMPIPMPRSALRLWRAVGKSDGIIIHDALYFTSIIAALSARWHRKPYILYQHIGAIPFANPALKMLMRIANIAVTRPMMKGAAQTVFISETVRRQFSNVRLGVAPKLIFNGVDTARFQANQSTEKAKVRAAFGLSQSRPVILFVGRFVEKKGLSILREIARDLPEFDFVMAGAGPMRPDEWGLSNLRVAGALAPDRLAELYRGADALLLPSTGEGFPLVIQEAMASGLPVFCGKESAEADPGAAAYLTGLPVDLSAPAESAKGFLRAIREQVLAPSPEAASYAAETYNWGRNALRLSDLFGKLCAAH